MYQDKNRQAGRSKMTATETNIEQAIKDIVRQELHTAVTNGDGEWMTYHIGGQCPVRAKVSFGNGMSATGQPATSALVTFANGSRWIFGGNGKSRWKSI
jgi:hypothetical protein